MKETETGNDAPASDGRREFLKKTGRFASAAPSVAFLLSTSLASEAVARSGGARGGDRGGTKLRDFLEKLFRLLFGH